MPSRYNLRNYTALRWRPGNPTGAKACRPSRYRAMPGRQSAAAEVPIDGAGQFCGVKVALKLGGAREVHLAVSAPCTCLVP